MKDQLLQQLRLLKLPGIREHLDARMMEAEANNLSHIEFLSMLMTDELDLRTTGGSTGSSAAPVSAPR